MERICHFQDGNTLFLGRKGADVSMLDLRMPSNHAIGELPGSQSAGYVHLLRTRPHTLITENFDGKVAKNKFIKNITLFLIKICPKSIDFENPPKIFF